MKIFLLSVVALVQFTAYSKAESLMILEDAIWNDSEIVLSGDVQIDKGATLTIGAGVTVKGNGYSISVFGSLKAVGLVKNVRLEDLTLNLGDQNNIGYIRLESVYMAGGRFNGNGYGWYDLLDSEFEGVGGFYLWYPKADSTILRNVFNNSAGLSIGINGPNLLIENNVFVRQSTLFAIQNWANYSDTLVVRNNSFLSLDKVALQLSLGYGSANLSAENNYFGTTIESDIDGMILDRNDDLNYANVIGFDPFLAEPHQDTPIYLAFNWDIDDDGEAIALTDGLMMIRHMFGFGGDSLSAGAMGAEAGRATPDAISSHLTGANAELDVDGDGESKALTDGLLLIRYLFGFSGDSLISGAIGNGAERNTAEEVEAYIEARLPPSP